MESFSFQKWQAENMAIPFPIKPEDIRAYQLSAWNKLLNYARKNQFHRNRLPVSIASLSEVQNLPFLSETDLYERGHQLLCTPQDEIERIVTIPTSGTTGKSKRLFFSMEDLEATKRFFQAGLSQFVHPSDSVFIMMPCTPSYSIGALISESILNLSAVPLKNGILTSFEEALSLLLKADSIIGPPIGVLALARYAKYKGIQKKLKGVLLSSDAGIPTIYRLIAEQFQTNVYNHYGSTESGYGGAVNCSLHNGMHPRFADLYFEVIDPNTEKPVPHGCFGEIVITTFRRNCLPLIRYRTGDRGRFMKEQTCECGLPCEKLDWIWGRTIEWERQNKEGFYLYELDELLFQLPFLLDYKIEHSGKQLSFTLACLPDTSETSESVKDLIMTSIPHLKDIYSLDITLTQTEHCPQFYERKRKIIIKDKEY